MSIRTEHVAIYINNLEAACDFFIHHLGGRSDGGYHDTTMGFRSYFITFEEDSRLEIMTEPCTDNTVKGINHMEYTHIASSVGSEGAAGKLTATPYARGYKILSGPRTISDGYYESCVVAIEGNRVEITVRCRCVRTIVDTSVINLTRLARSHRFHRGRMTAWSTRVSADWCRLARPLFRTSRRVPTILDPNVRRNMTVELTVAATSEIHEAMDRPIP